jgi:hypothetical protein
MHNYLRFISLDVGNPYKKLLVRSMHRWKNKVKLELKEITSWVMDSIRLVEYMGK